MTRYGTSTEPGVVVDLTGSPARSEPPHSAPDVKVASVLANTLLAELAAQGLSDEAMATATARVTGLLAMIASAELQTEAIARLARRVLDEDLRSIEVRAEDTTRFNEGIQAELGTMSWADDCPSFYRDATGRIVSFFPGTLGRMRRELRRVEAAFDVERGGGRPST